VLGSKYVMAFSNRLDLLWESKHLSEDGVFCKNIEGDIMTVECCLEPMSEKWFNAKISLSDGSIIYTPYEFLY
jgi:hypothetical protein